MRLMSILRFLIVVMFSAIVIGACGGEESEEPESSSGSGSAAEATATLPADTGSDTGEPSATTEGQDNVPQQWSSEPAMALEEGKDYRAVVRTSKGEMTIDLFEGEAPRTVNNFVFLANQGFYEGVVFHRIIKDFMVQTGDPTGTGAGGPGYRFADEPVTRDYLRGTVAMANAGPNTNGSQFFIVHADSPLPKNYTIFGTVTEGLDVLDAIANTPVRSNGREMSTPTEKVTIESVEIVTE